MSTLISKRILLVVFLFLVIESLHSQTFFKPDTYTTFDNRKVNVFILEGLSCVLNIDTSLIDTLILRDTSTFLKILERVDKLYSFYKTNLGFEPRGGNQKYGNKVNIFFGQPSCGAGCGYIGFKGVEVGFFDNIYFSIKNGILNNNPDGIIAYELGRNFFDFSNKILFPFRPNTFDRNGGFAEGFASLMTAYAYDEILKSPQERDLNENFRFIDYAEELFYGFISDSLATTENFLAQWDYKEIPSDLNFRINEPAFTSFGLLHGTIINFGNKSIFPSFFINLRNRPVANSKKEALSNLAISVSEAIKKNLTSYFVNVLKFELTDDVINEMKKFPLLESKLIKIPKIYWVANTKDNLKLSFKSTNFKTDRSMYKISLNGIAIDSNDTGYFSLPYNKLKLSNQTYLRVELIDQKNKILDIQTIQLKSRREIKLDEVDNKISYQYTSANKSKTYKVDDLAFVIENITKDFDHALIQYSFQIPRNRKFRISGEIYHKNKTDREKGNYAVVRFGNSEFGTFGSERIGFDCCFDSTKFYNIVFDVESDKFFKDSISEFKEVFLNLNQEGIGNSLSYFKNVKIEDISDSDNDGFVDFEDNCPSEKGTNNGCQQITNTIDIGKVGMLVYPNPASYEIMVKSQVEGILSIYNSAGHRVFSQEIYNQEEKINIESYPNGLYFVNLVGQGFSSSNKIMIKHN